MVACTARKPCSGLKNYFYWGWRDGSIDVILGMQHKDLSPVPRIHVKIGTEERLGQIPDYPA